MAWMKTFDQGYVNMEFTGAITTNSTSVGWVLLASGVRLDAGPYSTQSDASEAARKLVEGVDPGTIV
jgi:hypothetical protein